MSLRKIFSLIGIVSALVLAASSTAMAGPSGFSLNVVPQVSFVSPGQNVVVNYTATNSTLSSATCYIYVEEVAFNIPIGTIAGGTTAGGQLSTPANLKNGRLTFDLVCGGNIVAKGSVNVKVR